MHAVTSLKIRICDLNWGFGKVYPGPLRHEGSRLTSGPSRLTHSDGQDGSQWGRHYSQIEMGFILTSQAVWHFPDNFMALKLNLSSIKQWSRYLFDTGWEDQMTNNTLNAYAAYHKPSINVSCYCYFFPPPLSLMILFTILGFCRFNNPFHFFAFSL